MSVLSDTYAVILAGGQGTRFWPVSRATRPKQFLSISREGESLIQATARRVVPLVGEERVCIVTNEAHRDLILKEVPFATIIAEPAGRNTAASIALAAVHFMHSGQERIMIILPSDHAVQNPGKLLSTLRRAVLAARKEETLVTIGVRPAFPHTGYGYIRRGEPRGEGVFALQRFFEKPNLARAQEYVKSGEYYWNNGIFVWKASVFMRSVQEFMPELSAAMKKIAGALGAKNESKVLKETFQDLQPISVDFGILEHARGCLVVEADDYGWNDVGSWDAWAEHFDADDSGNVVFGDVLTLDSKNCVVYSKHRFTAVLGAKDLIVIDSGDALLVCPREQAQDVRKIVENLRTRGRTELL